MATATDADLKPGSRTSELGVAAICLGIVLFQDKLGIILTPTVENLLAAAPLLYIGGRNVNKLAAILSSVFGVKIPASLIKPEGENRREPTV